MITLICALGENNEIGKDNQLLWHLPDDLKRFKNLTTGHCIVMGRKTFESFPKPLPNRRHIVISAQPDYVPQGCQVVHSVEDALALALSYDDHPYVIGGAQIYVQTLPFAQRLELTRVQGAFDADAFFPSVDYSQWEKISSQAHPADPKHPYAFTFETYLKKRNI